MFKTKKALSLLLLLFSVVAAVAQNTSDYVCGTDVIHKYRMQTDSAYKNAIDQLEQNVYQTLNNNQFTEKSSVVYTIPLVVHVIHLGEAVGSGSNISDAQIQDAIAGINARYRHIIGDGLDIEIEFCLAQRDPDGNATTGINRVFGGGVADFETEGISVNGSPGANAETIKELSTWPYQDYYNIWVVHDIYGDVAGYANYPYPTVYDGTVMMASYMNYSSTTLAHEIGHGLNLMHTFNGDDNGCPDDTDCLMDGDRVCDTPPHRNDDCGATNPCSTAGIWNDSRYNYMSYCFPIISVARFTQGQKNRMRASLLATPRSYLLNSMACIPPAFGTFISKTDNVCFNECNGSITAIPSYPSVYTYLWNTGATTNSISGLCPGAYNVIITDSTNTSSTLNINIYSPDPVSITATVADASCSAADGSISVTASGGTSTLIQSETEDWEAGINNWTLVNGTQVNKWKLGNSISNGGAYSMYVSGNNNSNTYTNASNFSTVYFYKDFAFPTSSASTSLLFDWRCAGEFNYDYMAVYLAPDTFTPVEGTLPPANYKIGQSQYNLQNTFTTDTIDLAGFYSGSTKRIIFMWRNDYSDGVQPPAAIDNIRLNHAVGGDYTYLWNTNPAQTSPVISNLSAGTYICTVYDAINCSFTDTIEVYAQSLQTPVITQNGTTLTCSLAGMNSYQWYLNDTLIPLCTTGSCTCVADGEYTVTIVDPNNCTSTSQIFNATGCSIGINETNVTNSISIYPNPNSGIFTISAEIAFANELEIMIYNAAGELIYSELNRKIKDKLSKNLDLDYLAAGVYSIQVRLDNEVSSNKLVIMNRN